MDKIGVVCGRFQILHHEHMKYILAGKGKCEHLIIGITNFDISEQIDCQVDPHRMQKESNPFSYWERYEMIKLAVLEAGLKQDEFDIVPCPIDNPSKIYNYVPKNANFYVTIYDKWGQEKMDRLNALGFKVESLWTRSIEEKKIASTDIRRAIREGNDWEKYVPKSVYDYIKNNNLTDVVCGK